MDKDYYRILGVERKASTIEIKRAYRKLARKHHPDLNPGRQSFGSQVQRDPGAYSVLSDPKKKSQYDQFGLSAISLRRERVRGPTARVLRGSIFRIPGLRVSPTFRESLRPGGPPGPGTKRSAARTSTTP